MHLIVPICRKTFKPITLTPILAV
uniref:Uncharacterized protein n=1 Tax=Rhizophora mucronata TaxID=61149 RepID=A0A2P2IJ54_RHIMU